jgi:hypothetical protein
MSSESMLPFGDSSDAADCFAPQSSQPDQPKCPPDHWLDDALRAVPLPDGFLERVRLLARAAKAGVFDDGHAHERWQSI